MSKNQEIWFIWVVVIAFVALVYLVGIRPKIEICRVYYPEISTISCFVSDYGLPQPKKAKQ